MTLATLTILGSGNSAGVPTIGNHWGACDPLEPKNRRSRPCVLVRSASTALVIDTGPDFRAQINESGVAKIDAVLYSHAHSDHVMGIDDLRILSHRQKTMIPVYGSEPTLERLQGCFHYMFSGSSSGLYKPVLESRCIAPHDFGRPLSIGDLECTVFPQDHGTCETLGVRIGDTAYSPDMVNLPEASVEILKGIRNWIVDGAGYNNPGNPVHASIDKIYALNERIGASKVYLSHLSPAMDYWTLKAELKPGCEPACDGLEIAVEAM